jgi:hypothetical protein
MVNQKEKGKETQVKRRERGNIKTKHVKSLERMGIRLHVEKNQGTDETKT